MSMSMVMADGLNHIRAMRISEVMSDFRNLQHSIAQIRTAPSNEEVNLPGYALLRQCNSEGQAILNAPFVDNQTDPNGDLEQERQHLQYVFLDACSRRFLAQKIYLKATAAMRWINSRNAILQGGGDLAGQATALLDIDRTLQMELASITDPKVLEDLRTEDYRQGRWIDEDPSLALLQQRMRGGSR